MTPPGSITCTDKDHVKPSVLGPIGDGVKVLWARQYRVKPLMQNITCKIRSLLVKRGVKNATLNRCLISGVDF